LFETYRGLYLAHETDRSTRRPRLDLLGLHGRQGVRSQMKNFLEEPEHAVILWLVMVLILAAFA
jgi:hypothetical protein